MTILGIGIDTVEINRIKNIKNKIKFAKKILCINEFNEFLTKKNKDHFLAKRFASKEAAYKACSLKNIKKNIYLTDFEIFNNKNGKPNLIVLNETKIILKKIGVKYIHLSITDQKYYASAIVIIEN
ncbi:holo-ACP synthase [Buchnera aphidicola (Taiwanaphis decaspermi)]|uniref:holo-ACP synthase n=1 Tax=Buchnera aphidicola TaxID=9 RepID=UPI0031B81C76